MKQQTIKEIKDYLGKLTINELRKEIKQFESDERAGVKKVITTMEKKIEKHELELIRIDNMKEYERKYESYNYICGVDEVGRGPLSGPVVCAAVVLPKDVDILYINDSKKLSEAKRESLFAEIQEKAISIGIGMESVDTIDNVNILNATFLAMKEAVSNLNLTPDVVLVDGVNIPELNIKQETIIKGDEKSISIAAASIIAKVTRDHMMEEFNELYPEYNFSKNKGYGTKEHIEALKKYGACPIHRRSFIKNII